MPPRHVTWQLQVLPVVTKELIIYDIIGDIHGYADELVELLEQSGYTCAGGVFRHPKRKAVFCGDFIDRGPRIRDVIEIVRNMVEQQAAHAVMGNHEFNAIAFHTKYSGQSDGWYRPHTTRNIQQHQATLDQCSHHELHEALRWFRTLPISLDLGSIRIVHACWDPEEITLLETQLAGPDRFSPTFLANAVDSEHPVGTAIERVLKGPEVTLPDNATVVDKWGQARRRVRIRWFESPAGQTLGSYAFPVLTELEEMSVPASVRPSPYPREAPPLFIGHYSLDSRCKPLLQPNLACLDLSVARGGSLCGYRFNGESVLNPGKFVKISTRSC